MLQFRFNLSFEFICHFSNCNWQLRGSLKYICMLMGGGQSLIILTTKSQGIGLSDNTTALFPLSDYVALFAIYILLFQCGFLPPNRYYV